MLLNIAFAPRAVVKDFVFGPGISVAFKEAMGKNRLIEWDKQNVTSKLSDTEGDKKPTSEKEASEMDTIN